MAISYLYILTVSLYFTIGKGFIANLPAVIALGRALPPLKDISTGRLSGKVEVSLVKLPDASFTICDFLALSASSLSPPIPP
jgi:hypothetical protein